MSFDILNQLDDEPEKPGRKPPVFDTGFGGLTARQVAKATDDKSMAGQYKRWTVTVPPGQIDVIKQYAADEGMSALAFTRWLLDYALLEYDEGARPEIEEHVVRGEARKGHRSSHQ